MRRVLVSLGIAAALAGVLAPAAQAAQAAPRPHIICPWTVSVLYHAVTGEYLCYA